ncbi:enamine deaminase RidA (YjgF/YER057c/UK114 family) [Marmoricola sp. URHA0025 HA25]
MQTTTSRLAAPPVALNPSAAVVCDGHDQGQRRDAVSSLLTVAGQGPFDEHGRLLHLDDPVAQLLLTLANVGAVLAAGGLGWPDVAQLRVCSTDLDVLLDCYDAAVEHLADFDARPPTTFLEVRRLPVRGMTVCIDALAVR